jgi:hypothetical protein
MAAVEAVLMWSLVSAFAILKKIIVKVKKIGAKIASK